MSFGLYSGIADLSLRSATKASMRFVPHPALPGLCRCASAGDGQCGFIGPERKSAAKEPTAIDAMQTPERQEFISTKKPRRAGALVCKGWCDQYLAVTGAPYPPKR